MKKLIPFAILLITTFFLFIQSLKKDKTTDRKNYSIKGEIPCHVIPILKIKKIIY